MKIEKVKIEDLNSPEWNPRYISQSELGKLKTSLEEFGYVDPIIVNKHNMNIVGGNQRYLALKEMGYKEIEVVFVNEPNLEKEKALNIALNKISGDWDNEKLELVLEEIELSDFDVALTGFDDVEITELKMENDIDYDTANFNDSDLDDMYEEPEVDIRVCPMCGFEDQLVNFKRKE